MVFDGTPRLGGEELPNPRSMTEAAARALDAAIGPVDWAALSDGAERVVYEAPSGELAGRVAGDPDAPRFVLVPGVTGSKEDFRLMAPLLVRAGYRVESFDLAGQYESHAAGPEHFDPPRAHYDHELFVDDLIAVIEAGATPVHLLGYSFAGTVSQLVAAGRPELVASLTLLSTPPVSGQALGRIASVYGLGAIAARCTTAAQAASVLYWGLRRNVNHVPQDRYDFVMSRLPHTRRSSVEDIMRLMRHTPDVDAAIRALDVPKLVAFGRRDQWSPRRHRAFAARIGAESAEYDTGHSPCETTPHQLVRDMLRVIERDR